MSIAVLFVQPRLNVTVEVRDTRRSKSKMTTIVAIKEGDDDINKKNS